VAKLVEYIHAFVAVEICAQQLTANKF